MSKNQNIDQEAEDLWSEEMESDLHLSEEEYLIATLNSVSEGILSDEFYNRNKDLVRSMTNDFRDRHNRQGDMPPALAGRSIEIFFSGIAKFGLR